MITEKNILLEEPSFLVLNKPAGILTQAGDGIESVETCLRELLLQRSEGAGKPFIGLPHRLDRGTSGVLLIARNERSLRRFGEQFQSRKIDKRYLALCEGIVEPQTGTWIDHVRKIPDRPVAEIVSADHPDGRKAVLQYEGKLYREGETLLEIRLETGRMHQIRVQASSRGFPIVGDWCYGSQQTWGKRDGHGFRQELALHARRIEFRHPLHAKSVNVSAPLPQEWMDHLGIECWSEG